MLQVFYLDVCNSYTNVFKFFLVFCKCVRRMLQEFQLFRTYVASVSSRCCKSRSGVAHVATGPTCRSRLLQLLGCHCGSPCGRLRPVDASAARHPQARAGDWDSRGFLRADAVVRRNRASVMIGQHVVWGPCGGASENRRDFFRMRRSLRREGQEASDIAPKKETERTKSA
jgi:hypothetical protein